jgi:putative hemolysin
MSLAADARFAQDTTSALPRIGEASGAQFAYHWLTRPLAELGTLQVRIALTEAEIRAAQRLRYSVFFESRGLNVDGLAHDRTDCDAFDAVCDHLLVIDTALMDQGLDAIVGTYRLLPAARAASTGFYSAQEFDIRRFLSLHKGYSALELGRSCVAKTHRHRRTIELLWRGLWAYVQQHRIGLMFGCASLPWGTDIDGSLAYLKAYAESPAEWRVKALPGRSRPITSEPGIRCARTTFAGLPPLLKAYLRLGARVSSDAVDDPEFGTTDVFVALKVQDIAQRYTDHYSS